MDEIVIAGAGIGGLVLAVGLAQDGYAPIVCEKVPQIRDVGGTITLRSNATRILNNLGVLDSLLERSSVLTSASVHNKDGKLIRRWELPEMYTKTIICRRTDLQLLLLDKLKTYSHQLHLGHEVERYDQNRNRVTSFYKNGKTVEGDALIGADGIHSNLRKCIVSPEKLSYRGYVQWRFAPYDRHPIVGKNEKMEWWGPGLRFGVNPLGPTGMAWYISVNSKDPQWRGGENVREYMLALFKDWANPIQEMIAEVIPEQLVWNSIHDRYWISNWGKGRVRLLGDAAHPPTPDLGIGGTVAMEDAEELIRCLKENSDIIEALDIYQSRRLEKAKKLIVGSRFTGDMAQWSNPLLVAARQLAISKYPEALWKRHLQKTYL